MNVVTCWVWCVFVHVGFGLFSVWFNDVYETLPHVASLH